MLAVNFISDSTLHPPPKTYPQYSHSHQAAMYEDKSPWHWWSLPEREHTVKFWSQLQCPTHRLGDSSARFMVKFLLLFCQPLPERGLHGLAHPWQHPVVHRVIMIHASKHPVAHSHYDTCKHPVVHTVIMIHASKHPVVHTVIMIHASKHPVVHTVIMIHASKHPVVHTVIMIHASKHPVARSDLVCICVAGCWNLR